MATYSWFEAEMINIFHELRGGSVGPPETNLWWPDVQRLKRLVIEDFVSRVNARAEKTIEETHKVEGAHYNAMQVELKELQGEKQKG